MTPGEELEVATQQIEQMQLAVRRAGYRVRLEIAGPQLLGVAVTWNATAPANRDPAALSDTLSGQLLDVLGITSRDSVAGLFATVTADAGTVPELREYVHAVGLVISRAWPNRTIGDDALTRVRQFAEACAGVGEPA